MDTDTDFCRHYLRQHDAAFVSTSSDDDRGSASAGDNAAADVHHTFTKKASIDKKGSAIKHTKKISCLSFTLQQRFRVLHDFLAPAAGARLLQVVAHGASWSADSQSVPSHVITILAKMDSFLSEAKQFTDVEVGFDGSKCMPVGDMTQAPIGERNSALLANCFAIPLRAFPTATPDITAATVDFDAMNVAEGIKSIADSVKHSETIHLQRHYFPRAGQFTALLARGAHIGGEARIREMQIKRWLPNGVAFPLFRWFVGCVAIIATSSRQLNNFLSSPPCGGLIDFPVPTQVETLAALAATMETLDACSSESETVIIQVARAAAAGTTASTLLSSPHTLSILHNACAVLSTVQSCKKCATALKHLLMPHDATGLALTLQAILGALSLTKVDPTLVMGSGLGGISNGNPEKKPTIRGWLITPFTTTAPPPSHAAGKRPRSEVQQPASHEDATPYNWST